MREVGRACPPPLEQPYAVPVLCATVGCLPARGADPAHAKVHAGTPGVVQCDERGVTKQHQTLHSRHAEQLSIPVDKDLLGGCLGGGVDGVSVGSLDEFAGQP
jgi:hypothetical protein